MNLSGPTYQLGPSGVKDLFGALSGGLPQWPAAMAIPKQTDPQFKLRLSQSLRDRIGSSAFDNSRTLGAEIISRLEQSFELPEIVGEQNVAVAQLVSALQTSIAENAQLREDVRALQEKFDNVTNDLADAIVRKWFDAEAAAKAGRDSK